MAAHRSELQWPLAMKKPQIPKQIQKPLGIPMETLGMPVISPVAKARCALLASDGSPRQPGAWLSFS